MGHGRICETGPIAATNPNYRSTFADWLFEVSAPDPAAPMRLPMSFSLRVRS